MPSQAGGSQRALRRSNRRNVIAALRLHDQLSQAELAELTGLAPSSVSAIVRELTDSGLVTVGDGIRNGRRSRAVRLDPRGAVAGGFDFGRTHVRVALLDLSFSPLGARLVEYDEGTPATTAVELAVAAFVDLRSSTGTDAARLVGAGAGVPGPVDATTGAIGHGSILPEWVGTDPRTTLEQALGHRVQVDNDANLGALAEHTLGAARGHRQAVYLKIESGIGAGLVVDGRVARGGTGMAGEIGHVSVDEAGALCRCGSRGCLETRASVPVALEALHLGGRPALTAEDVASLARDGDPTCRRVVADLGRDVGVGLGALCNLLNPTVVVVDTTLAGAGDVLLDPMRTSLRRFAIPAIADAVELTLSGFDGHAPAYGAALLALDSVDPATSRERH